MVASKTVFLQIIAHLWLCCSCVFGIQVEPQSEMKCEFALIDWVDVDVEDGDERSQVRFALRRFTQFRESAETFGGRMYYTSGYVVSATKAGEGGVLSELIWLIPEPRVHMIHTPPVNFNLGDMVWEPETKTLVLAAGFSSAKQAYFYVQRVQLEFGNEGPSVTGYSSTMASPPTREATSAHTKLAIHVLKETGEVELNLALDDVPESAFTTELSRPSQSPSGVSASKQFGLSVAPKIQERVKQVAHNDLGLTEK